MSFSSEVKAELCRAPLQHRTLAVAEAYGVLLFSHTFTSREIRVVTASPDFAERLPRLFRRAFGVQPALAERKSARCIFTVTDAAEIETIFAAFDLEAERAVSHHINLGILDEPGCREAFLRGAFLAGGSVTDPLKSYHMELSTPHYSVSREGYALLAEMGFAPREISRSGNYILYFKRSEAIEDLLTTLGAPSAAMTVMSAKVEKSMTNNINRKVNCDSANADKIVDAAREQMEAIRRIERDYGLDALPEKLQEAALLRIANPEASLADLARLSYPSVTKSCLSYRLKKVVEFQVEE